jgi:hypothetical protein
MYDTTGCCLLTSGSDQFLARIGLSRKDILGRTFADKFSAAPWLVAKFCRAFRRVLRGAGPQVVRGSWHTATGFVEFVGRFFLLRGNLPRVAGCYHLVFTPESEAQTAGVTSQLTRKPSQN